MKKLICIILVICLFPVICFAETDLSSLTYDELVALKDQINLAIWNSKEWQEVTVPQGIWEVGKDIPAGTWTVRCADVNRSDYLMNECHISVGKTKPESGTYFSYSDRKEDQEIYNPKHERYEKGELTEYTFTLIDGDIVIIQPTYAPAVFTPYAGKPDLGFK